VFLTDEALHAQTGRALHAMDPGSSAAVSASGVGAPPDMISSSAGLAGSSAVPPAQPVGGEVRPAPDDVPAPAEEGGGAQKAAEGPAGSVVSDDISELAVAEGEAMDGDWFSDAVLLGDSRVDGFRLYSGAKGADHIVRAGMSVYEVDKEKQNISVGGAKYSAYQLLGKKQYAKVYLSIGVNELGYYDPNGYAETYEKIIDKVHQLQPNAQIYVMTIIPVNTKVCKANGQKSYINNDLIRQYNTALVEMAAEKDVLLIDAAEALAGEDGELLENMTSDGVHFTKEGYVAWKDYLLCHTGTEHPSAN